MFWITNSLDHGGELTVKKTDGKFHAELSWSDAEFVQVESAVNIEDALKKLEFAIMEDCAQEMIDKGAV